ncbi:hypothetical protein [Rhizobium glycinendophyticum]|uniref:hypothetical protein n=1 Tax=Rhizobium glycinendophyticum TaxID=2589807 RepID=UPI001FE34565|nr:hypothetical protein [Rhizobium glycinendophyticum]
MRDLHGSEDGCNAAMHFQCRRLTARGAGDDHFLYELADDADQRLLGLGISVISHHVKHGVDHRADCVFVDLVAQICEAFCIADWLVHRRRACQLPLQFFSFFIEPVELVVEGRDRPSAFGGSL